MAPSSPSAQGVLPEVLGAVQLALEGTVEGALERFTALWSLLPASDHFHRCIVAHYLADLQADPAIELEWDQRALEAALAATPASFEHRIPGVSHATFLPSLHLNLAASYARVGAIDAATRHAVHARHALPSLPATPLGDMTRAAIARICESLGVALDDAPEVTP